MDAQGKRASSIMVTGSPRSGTTWLGKIFDSHPDTLYSHEPDTCRSFKPHFPAITLSGIELNDGSVLDWIGELEKVRTARVVGKFPLFPKSYYSIWRQKLRYLLILAVKSESKYLGRINVPDLSKKSRASSITWVWKSIENTEKLGTIARVVENSLGILIVRHPCAVISSVLRGEAAAKFTSLVKTSEDLGIYEKLSETEQAKQRELSIDRFQAMSPLERMAWRWAIVNERAMLGISELPTCKVIRYEDLCADPLGISKQLLAFAGLEWSEQTEQFISQSTKPKSSSYYGIYKSPQVVATKWKQELSSDDADLILRCVEDTLPGRLFIDKPLPY